MKRLGLLGNTSWPSTLEYYRLINLQVAARLGGFHSADLILRGIDYHDIKSRYDGCWSEIPPLLEREMRLMLILPCDGIILCNNTLHKAFDEIRDRLPLVIPFFHAVELTAVAAKAKGFKRLLLLATRLTLEDGFFQRGLEREGLHVTVPEPEDREKIQAIQSRLAEGEMQPEFAEYFADLLKRHAGLDAAVLACTELPLAIAPATSPLTLLDPMRLQIDAAVEFMLS